MVKSKEGVNLQIDMKKKQVVLGIGSNLGDRELYLQSAINELSINHCFTVQTSSIYESEPWGFEADSRFYNAVILIETVLNPEELFACLKLIETKLGRIQKSEKRYSSREIDIDILFYDQEVINTLNLQIPHAKLTERRFVLEPMNEILPQFQHPILNQSVNELLRDCSDQSTVKIVSNALLINL